MISAVFLKMLVLFLLSLYEYINYYGIGSTTFFTSKSILNYELVILHFQSFPIFISPS